jgi:hypothetical protein
MSTMETKVFSVWSVLWLYYEYEASSTYKVNRVTTEKSAEAVQFEVELVTSEVKKKKKFLLCEKN